MNSSELESLLQRHLQNPLDVALFLKKVPNEIALNLDPVSCNPANLLAILEQYQKYTFSQELLDSIGDLDAPQ